MMRFATGTKFATIVAIVALSGCMTRPKPAPEVHSTAPSIPPPAATKPSIVPGSAEDLRVNVGDTVHFAYNRSDLDAEDQNIRQ